MYTYQTYTRQESTKLFVFRTNRLGLILVFWRTVCKSIAVCSALMPSTLYLLARFFNRFHNSTSTFYNKTGTEYFRKCLLLSESKTAVYVFYKLDFVSLKLLITMSCQYENKYFLKLVFNNNKSLLIQNQVVFN